MTGLTPIGFQPGAETGMLIPVSPGNPLPITGAISASNPSVGANGDPAPASSTQVGFEDGSGDLVPVSAGNPLPITGAISATNPSVGTNNDPIPASSTLVGFEDGGGDLVPISAVNPLPITGSISASNPSVDTTGDPVPASATYIGGNLAGNLTGLELSADGLKVDGSGVTQPVSVASLPLPADAATETTLAAVLAKLNATLAVTQSGTWTVGLSASQTIGVTNFPTNVAVNSGDLSNDVLRMCLATNSLAIALWGHGATGAAVPANATYVGMNVSGNLTGLVGTANGLKTDGSAVTQPVSGTVTANPSESTPVLKNGLTNSASAVVSSVAATLTSYYIYNPNASVAYLQIFDVATAGGVTVGTTTPKWSIGIPPGSAANLAGLALSFANGIQVAATTTATGSTAPSTALDCNFGYR